MYNAIKETLELTKEPQTLNSFEFTQLLINLNFAKASELTDDQCAVFKKCEELWRCLGKSSEQTLKAEERAVISTHDFKLYMQSIIGLTCIGKHMDQ